MPFMFLFTLFVLLALFMIATGVVQTAKTPTDPIEERIGRISKRTSLERALLDGVGRMNDVASEEEARARAKRKDWLPTVTRILSTQFWYERLDADLKAARSPWKASEILVSSFAVYMVVGTVVALLFHRMFGFLIGLPALAIPWLLVKFFQGQFIRRFETQLADTLTMMANALRGGYSYMQAVELVAREAIPPMGEEFRIMMQEMAVGITPDQSLLNFADRVRSPDVELMVTAVLIQRRVGGALAEILDNISQVIRDRVHLRGQIRALTAQGRLTGYMLAAMPIGIGLIVNLLTTFTTGESYMKPLFDTRPYSQGGYGPYGTYLVVIGIAMQIVGFMIIKKVTTIEV